MDDRPGCVCADAPAQLPRPLIPPPSGPAPEDLGLFGTGLEPPQHRPSARPARAAARHRRRTRRPAPALAVAAVAAMVGAVLLGTRGVSTQGEDVEPPPDERTTPTLALPTGDGGGSVDNPATPSGDASGPASTSPSASVSPSASASPPASASASLLASPSPSRSRSGATGVVSLPDSSPSTGSAGGPVLSEGSSGPEVRELQLRLKQEGGYGPKADGEYGRPLRDAVTRYQRSHNITGDPTGVYGPDTRRALESRTTEP